MNAVLFDLDGTLVDSAPDLRTAINAVLAVHGRRPLALDEVRRMVGDGARVLVRRALDATGGPLDDVETCYRAFLDVYEAHVCDKTAPYPGVREGLAALADRGYGLGVVTNKPLRHTRRLLDGLGLAFPVVIGGDSLPVKKPDPAPVRLALRELGVAPERALFVGDSQNDADAALGAGTAFVFARWGYGEGAAPAEARLESFDALLALVGRRLPTDVTST